MVNMIVISLLTILTLTLSTNSYIIDPGPTVIATKGEVWPKPQYQEKYDSYYILRPQIFEFKVITNNECSLLSNAFSRYHRLILGQYEKARDNFDFSTYLHYKKQRLNNESYIGYLDTLKILLRGDCEGGEYPSFNMNETYMLTILNNTVELYSNSTWGIIRGLETFSQLIYIGEDTVSLRINTTIIRDYPRFPHRGLLLDTSRHFIPVDTILLTLDAMAYNKMNVFHWHITDDQSFPYVSQKFPELSAKGAYTSSMVYSPSDVRRVIEYARLRGIRVLPEFDTPGHTRSWGEANRDLLTECYKNGTKTGQLGPIDPTKNSTYTFLRDLFEEIGDVFPDEYIHLGGDEVGFECWQSNTNITKFMDVNNITDYESLESYYIQKLINIVNQLNSSSIVWEEVFRNGVTLPNETIVHIWIGAWQLTMYAVTIQKKKALLSSCWYLDHLSSGGDWSNFYACEPYNFGGNDEQKSYILGGEACMWAEAVNQYNVISRVWPRASATAEKLWSAYDVNDTNDAAKRLEEHTCRMNRRGIGAQPPNSAGYCL